MSLDYNSFKNQDYSFEQVQTQMFVGINQLVQLKYNDSKNSFKFCYNLMKQINYKDKFIYPIILLYLGTTEFMCINFN